MGRESTRKTSSKGPGGLELPKPKETLAAYYARGRMTSPVGGVLQVLGVHALADGSATLILECNT